MKRTEASLDQICYRPDCAPARLLAAATTTGAAIAAATATTALRRRELWWDFGTTGLVSRRAPRWRLAAQKPVGMRAAGAGRAALMKRRIEIAYHAQIYNRPAPLTMRGPRGKEKSR